jgi:hypothetical protein
MVIIELTDELIEAIELVRSNGKALEEIIKQL